MRAALIPRGSGATLDADGVALSFGDDEAALEALADRMVVFDRSHWVRGCAHAAQQAQEQAADAAPGASLRRAACACRARARWRSCRRR